jgi:hypothetical protein
VGAQKNCLVHLFENIFAAVNVTLPERGPLARFASNEGGAYWFCLRSVERSAPRRVRQPSPAPE